MVRWSSPAKAILFGEHAVVYGQPALAVALDRRVSVDIRTARESTVNRWPMTDRHHGYIKKAVELSWGQGPVEVTTRSSIPSASGMGSSAAITVASTAAALELAGGFDPERCARISHRAESLEEGRMASPLDTSTCTLGSGVLVSQERGEGLQWYILKEDEGDVEEGAGHGGGGGPEGRGGPKGRGGPEGRGGSKGGWGKKGGGTDRWFIHRFKAPELTLVLGHTGLKARTRAQVQKVQNFTHRQKGFAKDILAEIGEVTLEGARALKAGDHTLLGELMDRNDKLLGILGVSSPELGKLVDAARRSALGAKMIGSGGGGCMMALTEKPERTAEAIKNIGGEPYVLRVTDQGVRKEDR